MNANIIKQLGTKTGRAGLMAVILCTAPCLLLETAVAQTTANSPARIGALSKLPDWSGLWRLKGSPGLLDVENGRAFTPGSRDHPPYKPDWEARYTADLVRGEHQGDASFANPLVDSHTKFCAAGMPRLIGTPFDYEFIVTPEETWIVVEKEIRHIYTDGRKFPPEDELWPTLAGRSIGHWEGQTREDQTLVVETLSVRAGLWADTTPATLSEKARFTERIRQTDANTIEDQTTVTDPEALTKPWTFVKHYTRMKPGSWAAEPETCGGPDDRNPIVDGRVTVVLPSGK